VRSLLTVASVAVSLAMGTMLATLPSPAAAAPPDAAVASADTTIRSTDLDGVYSFEYLWRHARPVIGIQYGFGDVDRDGFGGDLASVGALDVQLGYRIERRFAGEDALLHQSTNFAHVGNFASRLRSDAPGPSEVGTDMWRFGLGFGDGYGYRFASDRGRLVLQNSGTFGWYTLDLQGEAVGRLSPSDAAMLEQFTSHTRYGDSWESAVEVGFGDMLALHAGYERTAVFPSFKIWYWMFSTMIDRGALLAADMFVGAVEDASPFAAPVMRFLLEGAFDMFKLGITARF
jgi:hypothetical protein